MLFISIACALVAGLLAKFADLPSWVLFALLGVAAIFALLSFLDRFFAQVSTSSFSHRHKIMLIFLPLFLLVNIAARYYDHVFDLSRGRLYSFRPESVEWLRQVDRDVTVTVFSKSEEMGVNARWVASQLSKANPRIRLQVKNLNKEPVLARKYGVSKAGETVLETGGVWTREEGFFERTLMSAMVYLVAKSNNQICFSFGAGESDIADESSGGLSELRDFTHKLGYSNRVVDIGGTELAELEKQCGLLVVMGASKPLFPLNEEKLHQLFFQSKLPLFLALGEDISATWKRILSDAGIQFSPDVVIDPHNDGSELPVMDHLVRAFAEHPVVGGLTDFVYFSHAHHVSLKPEAARQWVGLLHSSDAELVDLASGKNIGDFSVFALASASQAPGRKIIFTSKRTFTNRYIDFGSAEELFINSVRWLLDENAIQWAWRQDRGEKYLQFSPAHMPYVKWASFLVLPLLVFMGCFLVWLQRIREK